MNAHLARTARPVAALVGKAISRTVLPYTSSCAVPVLGGAGRHGAKAIAVPGKICPVHLPPCRTGLNPVGKVSAPSRSPTPVRPSPNRVLKKSTGRRGCLTEMREPLAPVRALCTLAGAIAPATAPGLTQASRGAEAPGQRPPRLWRALPARRDSPFPRTGKSLSAGRRSDCCFSTLLGLLQRVGLVRQRSPKGVASITSREWAKVRGKGCGYPQITTDPAFPWPVTKFFTRLPRAGRYTVLTGGVGRWHDRPVSPESGSAPVQCGRRR